MIDALTGGKVDELPLHQPTDREQLHAQLTIERRVSRVHLTAMVDHFYDRGCRRDYSGGEIFPQDHLRWAAYGFLSIDDFLTGESGSVPQRGG